jgi:hypothetical protein
MNLWEKIVRGKSDSGCDERFFPVKTSIVLIHNALTSDTSVAWRIAQFMTLECKRKQENDDATWNKFVQFFFCVDITDEI